MSTFEAAGSNRGVPTAGNIALPTHLERELEPIRDELARALNRVGELRESRGRELSGISERAESLREEIRSRLAEAARLRREEGEREARLIRAIAQTEAARLEAKAGEILAALDPPDETEPAAFSAAPLLVPLLGFREELALRAMVLVGVASAAWFWTWWLGEGHGSWSPTTTIVTFLFAWLSVLTLYFLFFVTRMTRPNPALPPPRLRTAMVVTKAPSEPWAMVEKTLEAMLGQSFPHPYDVWLADEQPSEYALRWCLAHGVKISTRFGVEEYHRETWPRRTKCKEGNLAWFYDTVGYDRYDVVSQLDADHVPAPDYLAAIVRPFRDPAVGYVSAPSICDANADVGWTVRGRLYREATLHGPVQAGSNQGYGPVCIGSHYAVRTAALLEVGGLGPELAEDFTTTLWLQSGGWTGVFNVDAIAHGDGPESLAEMMTQEVQWARSLGTVLVRYAPEKLKTVPLRARIRLGFALFFYPMQGIALALAAVLPTAGVVFSTSWGDTSLAAFYGHLWPMSLTGITITAYLRRKQLLRPSDAKLWSWELMVFQLIRWPWAMLGAFQGMWVGLQGRERAFKVTPKGERGLKPLPLSFLIPSLALGAVPAWVALATIKPGPAIGLLMLAMSQALVYLVVVTVATGLHVGANANTVVGAGGHSAATLRRGLTAEAGGQTVIFTLGIALPTLVALLVKFAG